MKTKLLIIFTLMLLVQNSFSQNSLKEAEMLLEKAKSQQLLAEIKINQAEYLLGQRPQLLTSINKIIARINVDLRKNAKNAPLLMARSYAYFVVSDYLQDKIRFGKNKLNDTKIKNNLALANKDIENAVNLDKSMGDYFNVRGKIRLAQCNIKIFKSDADCLEKPFQDFTAAINSAPDNFGFYYDRISLYKSNGQNDEANADEQAKNEYEELFNQMYKWQEAIEKEKTEKNYYELAATYNQMFEKNIKHAEKNNYDLDYVLANFYENQFSILDQSLNNFSIAIQISPNKDYLYSSRGGIYVYFGSLSEDSKNKPRAIENYELAVKDFTQAIKLNPKNHFYYEMRAEVYEYLGKKDLQKADLEQAEKVKN